LQLGACRLSLEAFAAWRLNLLQLGA